MININISKIKSGSKIIADEFTVKHKKGEFLIIHGATGCGKTSILKAIAGIIPYLQDLKVKRIVSYNGKSLDIDSLKENISYCFQEAEDQFLFNIVEHEISSNVDSINETKKAKYLIKLFDIDKLLTKSLNDISTGERKIVSLITTLVSDKEIILLDEPTANLDHMHTRNLISFINKIKSEKIVIIASHDPHLLKETKKILYYHDKTHKWLGKAPIKENKIKKTVSRKQNGKPILVVKNASYTFPDGKIGLKKTSMKIKKGEIVGVVGKNGTGKTTLINLMLKNIKPSKGTVWTSVHNICMINQEPEKQLFEKSVKEELVFGDKSKIYEDPNQVLKQIGLYNQRNEHPFFLSRGQKQLLLLFSVMLKKPEFLVIDEPFTGLDFDSINLVCKKLMELNKIYNTTILLTDQNKSQISGIVDSIYTMENGRII